MIVFALLLLLLGFAAAVGWLIYEFVRAPYLPDPGTQPLTVDAVIAAAALTPDSPLFTDDQDALLHADEIGAHAEAWLADKHTRES